ncbi:MAG: hypothetical protein ABI415_01760 [Flavitalea sp.]
MSKAKKGLTDDNKEGFILNESGTSVTVDHVQNEDEKKDEDEVSTPRNDKSMPNAS